MNKYISNRNHTIQWIKWCRAWELDKDKLQNDLQYTIKVHVGNKPFQFRTCKNSPCSPDLKFGILVCSDCNWSEKI